MAKQRCGPAGTRALAAGFIVGSIATIDQGYPLLPIVDGRGFDMLDLGATRKYPHHLHQCRHPRFFCVENAVHYSHGLVCSIMAIEASKIISA